MDESIPEKYSEDEPEKSTIEIKCFDKRYD